MRDNTTILYFSALLHDIGKLLFRSGVEPSACAEKVAEFLQSGLVAQGPEENESKQAIIDLCRSYTNDALVQQDALSSSSLVHLIDFADKVASGVGHNNAHRSLDSETNPSANLKSIFNCVNGSKGNKEIEHDPYQSILSRIEQGLQQVPLSDKGIGAIDNLLEDVASTLPASTDPQGLIDVSWYDHAKSTACFASCAQQYFLEKSLGDADESTFLAGEDPFREPVFLLLACDLSGIQRFIYNISGAGALRQLRARSLYLELLLEIVVDRLLDCCNMHRCNVQYVGGGHFYAVFPNTESNRSALESAIIEAQDWFITQYKTDLFLSAAWIECSADDLTGKAQGRGYANTYRNLSQKMSRAKAARYTTSTLLRLNYPHEAVTQSEVECSECHRSDLRVSIEGKCTVCAALGELSRNLPSKSTFAVIRRMDESGRSKERLPLPFGWDLTACMDDGLLKEASVIRIYEKNSTGNYDGNKQRVWIADYCAEMDGRGIASYSERSSTLEEGYGVSRLGILRADVDNLGATFVEGIPEAMQSFSRGSALSRALNMYFKVEVNELLRKGDYQAQVIYSGGDDLFILGNWSDVLYAATDISGGLRNLTGSDAITMSAGVGIYSATYPVARIALEVGELEDAAKLHESEYRGQITTKNAVALWEKDNIFCWQELASEILPLKNRLQCCFAKSSKGKSFVYKLLALLRNYQEIASAPRLAYLLARSFEDADQEQKSVADELYRLAQKQQSRHYLVAALEWYVYSIRERS